MERRGYDKSTRDNRDDFFLVSFLRLNLKMSKNMLTSFLGWVALIMNDTEAPRSDLPQQRKYVLSEAFSQK